MPNNCVETLCLMLGVTSERDWRRGFIKALCESGDSPDEVIFNAKVAMTIHYVRVKSPKIKEWSENTDNKTKFLELVEVEISEGRSDKDALSMIEAYILRRGLPAEDNKKKNTKSPRSGHGK